MWLLLKGLAFQFVVGRTLGGVMALLLALMVPLAGLLKFIGLPILIVLGLLGAPVMVLLAAVGLPVILVVGVGGALIAAVGLVLALGLMAIKVLLPLVLIIWFARWILRSLRSCRTPPVVSDPGPVSTGAPD